VSLLANEKCISKQPVERDVGRSQLTHNTIAGGAGTEALEIFTNPKVLV
jgi:hypothetical protein